MWIRRLPRSFDYPLLASLQISFLSGLSVDEDSYWCSQSADDGCDPKTLLASCNRIDTCGDSQDTDNESEDHSQAFVPAIGCDDLRFQVLPMAALVFCHLENSIR